MGKVCYHFVFCLYVQLCVCVYILLYKDKCIKRIKNHHKSILYRQSHLKLCIQTLEHAKYRVLHHCQFSIELKKCTNKYIQHVC